MSEQQLKKPPSSNRFGVAASLAASVALIATSKKDFDSPPPSADHLRNSYGEHADYLGVGGPGFSPLLEVARA